MQMLTARPMPLFAPTTTATPPLIATVRNRTQYPRICTLFAAVGVQMICCIGLAYRTSQKVNWSGCRVNIHNGSCQNEIRGVCVTCLKAFRSCGDTCILIWNFYHKIVSSGYVLLQTGPRSSLQSDLPYTCCYRYWSSRLTALSWPGFKLNYFKWDLYLRLGLSPINSTLDWNCIDEWITAKFLTLLYLYTYDAIVNAWSVFVWNTLQYATLW